MIFRFFLHNCTSPLQLYESLSKKFVCSQNLSKDDGNNNDHHPTNYVLNNVEIDNKE